MFGDGDETTCLWPGKALDAWTQKGLTKVVIQSPVDSGRKLAFLAMDFRAPFAEK
jgi:hypothetical protein